MNNELTPMFAFHITMGTLALLSGAAALVFKKGGGLHRHSGKVFVITMIAMSLTGIYLAFLKPALLSVIVGLLTFYLVASSWITVWRKPGQTGYIEIAALIVVLATAIGGFLLGAQAANSELGYTDIDGFKIPPGIYYFFASVAAFCAALDIQLIMKKGVSGKHRVARHLWRMCFALYIAAASIFLGNPQVFPESIRGTLVLSMPVIIVLLLMIYWLLRTLFFKRKLSV